MGVVEKSKIVSGKKIERGNVLIGLESNGLHTNGYSLARVVLMSEYSVRDNIDELGSSIGEELLRVHRPYLNSVLPLVDASVVNGISHITGGGIIGNTSRIVPDNMELNIDWDSWERPPIFEFIRRIGDVDEEEMRHVFNLGIGMILVVDKNRVDDILKAVSSENPKVIGEIR